MHFRMHFFFFNDTATTEIYTLSLHDALPILPDNACGLPPIFQLCRNSLFRRSESLRLRCSAVIRGYNVALLLPATRCCRSEEHTSELQSCQYLVCRLLLEKKKNVENRNCNRS